ncbi:hypothetical protein ACM43_26155 [Bradyrhizobium sp. CCBAU 45321]|nr:hypothetical protein [Bradyrhizobium sp. CCBAU 45321]
MMMRDHPFSVALHNHKRKTRWSGFVVLFLSGKVIKSCDNDSVFTEHDYILLLYRVPAATLIKRNEILPNRLRASGRDRVGRSEKKGIRRIESYQCITIIGAVCCRPLIDHGACLLCRASESWRCHRNERHA